MAKTQKKGTVTLTIPGYPAQSIQVPKPDTQQLRGQRAINSIKRAAQKWVDATPTDRDVLMRNYGDFCYHREKAAKKLADETKWADEAFKKLEEYDRAAEQHGGGTIFREIPKYNIYLTEKVPAKAGA